VPLEIAICQAAVDLAKGGVGEFHGYELAKRLSDIADHRLLTGYGTLYRALARLERMGLVDSHWEDPHIAARENRPGWRLYTLSAAGEAALREHPSSIRAAAPRRTRRRLAPA
jgi:DNA-binding PadR family transcriptional regulator